MKRRGELNSDAVWKAQAGQVGERKKFLLEISTAENCSEAGGDLKDSIAKAWRWSLYWTKLRWSQHIYVIIQCKIRTCGASCLLKNMSTEQQLVSGPKVPLACVLSQLWVSENRPEWGRDYRSAAPSVASKPAASRGWRSALRQGWSPGTQSPLSPWAACRWASRCCLAHCKVEKSL